MVSREAGWESAVQEGTWSFVDHHSWEASCSNEVSSKGMVVILGVDVAKI